MHLTIVGAGAIGGTVGAYLQRAGQPVLLVDQDAAHVAAMRERGLTIRGFAETFTVPVEATTTDALTGPLDTVLLAVKAQHTVAAVTQIAHLLTPSSMVVSLQNGLCERFIAEIVGPERTVGAFVNFSADYLEPGVIAYGGPGSLYLGELGGEETARVQALRETLSVWGDVKITANIWGYLWGKEGYGNMLFATALADETMADVLDRYRPLMVELGSEVLEVAAREGIVVEPFDNVEPSLFYPRADRRADAIARSFDDLIARRRRDLKTKSGIWRDLAVRRRKTEVDDQLGLITAIGAGHGLSMPLTTRLVAMIHDLEEGRRVMSWNNLEELDTLRRASYGDAAW
ncbi:MAG TPA: 2-dehydropantoate 2-reductase [Chloroflexota bacterium]|nr:2-dehydropantoate 2-reductase [Chloroflexota bacterium]